MSTAPSSPAAGAGPDQAALQEDEPSPREIVAMQAEADAFRLPAPPPIPVRDRYYLTECERCDWIGSSEQCGGGDEDVVCPVCCSSIAGDAPSEAGAAKHGEAVYQRIVALAAECDAAVAERDEMRAVAACPIGIPVESRGFCSAGTCYRCLADRCVWSKDQIDKAVESRAAALRAEADRLRAENARLLRTTKDRKAILEHIEAAIARGDQVEREGPAHVVILANLIDWDDPPASEFRAALQAASDVPDPTPAAPRRHAMRDERARIEGLETLLARANLLSHIDRTLSVGIPRLDPKTRHVLARQIALKVRLALLHQTEPAHADR